MPVVSVLQVLRTIKDRGSISRTDLQQVTGLSWGTVTNTTRELLGRGLIREEGAIASKAGRKPVRLALSPEAECLLGAEIAPGVIRCAALNIAGKTLWQEEAPLDAAASPEANLLRLVDLVQHGQAALEPRGWMGVGVALPGAVDAAQGVLRGSALLPGWRNVPVRAILEERLVAPVRVERRATCSLMAERWFGRAGLKENMISIDVGEEISAGILIGGEIFRGSAGHAGQLGHVALDPAGPVCSCGRRGCLAAYCVPAALAEFAHSVASEGENPSKMRTLDGLAELAGGGHAPAAAALERCGGKLGAGAAMLIALFDPEVLVLTGLPAAAHRFLAPALEREIAAAAAYSGACAVVYSELGKATAAMGACGLVLQGSVAHETAEQAQPLSA